MINKNIADGERELLIWQTEITLLAEQNSSFLLKTLRSGMPIFITALLKHQPKLLQSELVFCIYLRMNFTTKEIAKFLNVSPKAIQNRKNRLRKKLNIEPNGNLYKWMSDLYPL